MKQGDKKGKGMSLTEPYVSHCLQHPSSAQPSPGGTQGRRAPSPGGCHLAPQNITCTSAEGGQGASTGAGQKPKGAPGSSDFFLAREAPSLGDPEPLSGQPEGILGVLRGCCGSSS